MLEKQAYYNLCLCSTYVQAQNTVRWRQETNTYVFHLFFYDAGKISKRIPHTKYVNKSVNWYIPFQPECCVWNCSRIQKWQQRLLQPDHRAKQQILHQCCPLPRRLLCSPCPFHYAYKCRQDFSTICHTASVSLLALVVPVLPVRFCPAMVNLSKHMLMM